MGVRLGTWLRALVLGLSASACAHATGPSLSYNPVPDQTLAQGADCFSAPSNPAFEIDFAGACTPGAACDITATNNNDGGSGIADITFLSCDAQNTTGDGNVDVVVPGGALQFTTESGNAVPPSASFSVTCSSGTQLTQARVCCTESRGGVTVIPFWDVRCPASGAPAFGSMPGPGSTLTIATTTSATGQTTLTVNNTGTANLLVTPSGLSDELSIAPSTQATIAPSQSQVFTISCTSGNAGSIQQMLTLATNDAAHNPETYNVSCTVTPPPEPNIVVTPAPPGPLSIASVRPANGSANLHLANTGNAALTLAFSGLAAPFSISPAAPISAGGSADFTVSCSGANPGAFNDVLTIASNDPDEPTIDMNVDCTVTAATFDGSPAPPGPIAIGTTQAASGTTTDTFTVTNIGTATLAIGTLIEATPGGTITVSPASANIAPGNAQVFTVSCSRTVIGSFTDSVTLPTNDADLPNVVYNLSCDVTGSPQPEFSSTPAAPGPVAIVTGQSATGTATLTVENAGTATLTLNPITEGTPGGVITVTPAAPINVAAGATQNFTVSCTSASAGTFNDTVTFTTNDTTGNEGTVTFNLQCTVNSTPVVPEFTANPAAPGPLTITTTQPNSASTTVTVTNIGNANLAVTSVTGLAAPFSVSPASATILPGASRAFVFTCSGSTPGTYNDQATLNTNDADESAVLFDLACTVAPAPANYVFVTPAQSATPGTAVTTALSGPVATDTLATATLTFRNSAPAGGSTLNVRAIQPASPFSVTPTTTVTAVANNGQNSVTARCTPKVIGTVSTTIQLDTNAPNVDPARYPVTCTGTAGPEFSSVPAPASKSYSFTLTKPTPTGSSTSSAILRVTNSGASTLRLLSRSGLSGNLFLSGPVFPVSIAPSSFVDLVVNCTTTIAGDFSQTLTLTTNDISESRVSYGVTCRVYPPLKSRRALHAVLSTSKFDTLLFSDGFEDQP